MVGVVGSSPIAPTNTQSIAYSGAFLLMLFSELLNFNARSYPTRRLQARI